MQHSQLTAAIRTPLGAGVAFRLAGAIAAVAVLWLAVVWAIAA